MGLVDDALQQVVELRLETRFGPPLVITQPFAPDPRPSSEPGTAAALLQAAKPKLTVVTTVGERSVAPYGEPGESLFPTIVAVGAVIAGVALALVILKRA